jgi:hypothetical protein
MFIFGAALVFGTLRNLGSASFLAAPAILGIDAINEEENKVVPY